MVTRCTTQQWDNQNPDKDRPVFFEVRIMPTAPKSNYEQNEDRAENKLEVCRGHGVMGFRSKNRFRVCLGKIIDHNRGAAAGRV